MVERGEGPKSGATRDNGLRAASYVAVGDLDPRVADALLVALRSEGIAAYVAPTPGVRGGYLEVRLPSQPTDRLYVDEARLDQANVVVESERGTPPEPSAVDNLDVDTAWQQVLVSLQSSPTLLSRPWPASEDLAEGETVATDLPAPPEDEHFVPPAPPPLPTLRPITIVSLLAILAGVLILVTGFDGGTLQWLGILAILGGAASLVWHVKEGPPTDSGWDDGAVV